MQRVGVHPNRAESAAQETQRTASTADGSGVDVNDDQLTRRPGSVPPRHDRRGTRQVAVSVVLPTFNEAENVPELVERLSVVLSAYDHEILVVDDDSPDQTWAVADDLTARFPRLQSVRRVGERGLSSAVLHGFHLAAGRVLVVMDADLQHDAAILPSMIDPVLAGEVDMTVGSREAEGGSYGDWSASRRFVSWGGKQLACRMLGLSIGDPMSGFFAISRDRFHAVEPVVNPRGFKILLEFLARGERPSVREVGYKFQERTRGVTKLTGSVVGAYLLALVDLVIGRVVAATVTAFAMVGLVSMAARLVLFLALRRLGAVDGTATLVAFEASALLNYALNNRFTFAPMRRRGWAWLRGLVPFHIVALHGFLVQQGVGAVATERVLDGEVSVSHPVVLAAGVAVAAAGNFVLHGVLTWRVPRPQAPPPNRG